MVTMTRSVLGKVATLLSLSTDRTSTFAAENAVVTTFVLLCILGIFFTDTFGWIVGGIISADNAVVSCTVLFFLLGISYHLQLAVATSKWMHWVMAALHVQQMVAAGLFHLIARRRPDCNESRVAPTAAWILIVAQCSAIP